MPSDTIQRAIKKGTGELPGVNYEESTYEGYGPGGVAILMEVLTDNKNRSLSEIRHLFTRADSSLSEPGAVSWMFAKQGQIRVSKNITDEDTLMDIVLDAEQQKQDAFKKTRLEKFGGEEVEFGLEEEEAIEDEATDIAENRDNYEELIQLREQINSIIDTASVYRGDV